MKITIFIAFLLALASCKSKHNANDTSLKTIQVDTIIKHDTIFQNNNENWQEGFNLTHDPDQDSIWGKPVSFYINNPNCSPIAKDFYSGQFRPTDNEITAALLKLATIKDNQLRPFYRWCLNKTIIIQDGALAEYTGIPAREYAEKFPLEFFEYMDFDTSGQKYRDWISAISYSGSYENEDYKKPEKMRNNIISTMKKNCNKCGTKNLKRIEKFAKDCF